MPVSQKPRRPKRLQHTRRATFKGMRFVTLMERTNKKRASPLQRGYWFSFS